MLDNCRDNKRGDGGFNRTDTSEEKLLAFDSLNTLVIALIIATTKSLCSFDYSTFLCFILTRGYLKEINYKPNRTKQSTIEIMELDIIHLYG